MVRLRFSIDDSLIENEYAKKEDKICIYTTKYKVSKIIIMIIILTF